MDHFSEVQTWLVNSYNIKVVPDWLSACLEWIAQESEGLVQSVAVVRQQVFEQWLTSDLAEIGDASLPAAAATCDKMELISNYPLQIISIVDVGFPLYGQQQKITGRENLNAQVSADKPFQPAWEPKQSRMLLLTLTDGHSEIKAIEYQPIKFLHSHLPSGTKCVISGTVLCRRGMVLLTEEHIHLLGGEVDTLAEVNTPLSVLQQAMEKSRADEGKHAKQVLSGRFITRGCKEKLNLPKKTTFSQKQGSGSGLQHSNHLQISSQFGVKREEKPVISAMGKVKTEIKCEQKWIGFNSGSGTQQEAEEEWGDDINYSELFDNDMDFEDGLEADQNINIADRDGSKNCFKGVLGVCNAPLSNRSNSASKTKCMSSKTSDIMTEESISNDVIDVFDDDDMELENVFEDSPPSWRPGLQTTSWKQNRSEGSKLGNNSSSTDKPKLQTSRPTFVSAKQEVSSQSTQDISPQVPNQDNQIEELLPERLSPTFTSPVSSAAQVSVKVKKPLFKMEQQNSHNSSQKNSLEETSVYQAKKPKVQAKLSDLFFKQSKTTVTNAEKDNNGGASLSQSSYDNQTAVIPDITKKLSSKDKSVISGENSARKPLILSAKPNTSEGLRGMPRAVIQPFSTANNTDPECDDSTVYNNLSDLHNPTAGSIKVKVSILTLIEKLCSNDGSHWSLACRISDNVTNLDVDISNVVLTGLIGFSAIESIAMRQRFKSEPDIKEIFAEGLSQCQSKLMSGRGGCLVELEPASRNPSGKRPVIVNLSLQQS